MRQVYNTPLCSSLPPLMATINWFSMLSNTQSHCSWSLHNFKCCSLNVKPLSPILITQPTPSHSSKLFKEHLLQEAVLGSIVLLSPTHPSLHEVHLLWAPPASWLILIYPLLKTLSASYSPSTGYDSQTQQPVQLLATRELYIVDGVAKNGLSRT